MQEITGDKFTVEVLEADKPVLVCFSAEGWCQPCKLLAPTFKTVAEEYDEKMKFVKLDADTEDELTMKYNVMSVPTMFLFKEGKVVAELNGNKSKEDLISFVQQAL